MQPLPGDGPVLDMLLEPTLIGEDLVAEVAVLLLLGEKEPEEEAIDPAHEARQEGAEGGGRGAHYPAFSECRPRVGPWAEFFAKRGLVLYTHSHLRSENVSTALRHPLRSCMGVRLWRSHTLPCHSPVNDCVVFSVCLFFILNCVKNHKK